MARVARVVIAEVAHHVTQRGNGRQFILATDAERWLYLDLMRQAVRVAERLTRTLAWRCPRGGGSGRRTVGGNSRRRERGKRTCERSAAVPTRADPWVRRSLRTTRKNGPSAA